jgi:hypothetical protein
MSLDVIQWHISRLGIEDWNNHDMMNKLSSQFVRIFMEISVLNGHLECLDAEILDR